MGGGRGVDSGVRAEDSTLVFEEDIVELGVEQKTKEERARIKKRGV